MSVISYVYLVTCLLICFLILLLSDWFVSSNSISIAESAGMVDINGGTGSKVIADTLYCSQLHNLHLN